MAAILAKQNYRVTIFEAHAKADGVLRYGIPEYRLPKAVLAAEVERIRALGVEIRCNVRVGREITFGELDRHAAVFIATGAHRSRSPTCPAWTRGAGERGSSSCAR